MFLAPALLLCISLGFVLLHVLHLLALQLRAWLLSPVDAKGSSPSWCRSPEYIKVFPVTAFLSAVAFSIALMIERPHIQNEDCIEAIAAINLDIGGPGVFLGLFIPSIALLLILLWGHFKAEPAGAKEIALAQLANTVYLLFNVAKAMNTLGINNLLVACSSLDAVSASLSMAFSDKDVVAARNLVGYGFICQTFAFGIECWGAFRIGQLSSTGSSACATTAQHILHSNNIAIAKFYLSIRLLALLILALKMWELTRCFNDLEHTGSQGLSSRKVRAWSMTPATFLSNYFIFASFALIHASSLLNITWTNAMESLANLRSEWGQSAPFILAIYVTIHVAYSSCKLFSQERTERRAQVCQALGGDASWYRGDVKWWQYPSWLQRLPFKKHKLCGPDELLLSKSPDPLQIDSTAEELDELWNDLTECFSARFVDQNGILHALEAKVPLDRVNDRNEYALHMAARLGDVPILRRIQDDLKSKLHGQLLHPNASGLTPLEIAYENNRTEAVELITVQLLDALHRTPESESLGHKVMVNYIERGDVEAVRNLLNVWTSSFPFTQDPSPLRIALQRKNFRVFRLLRDSAVKHLSFIDNDRLATDIIPCSEEDLVLIMEGLEIWQKIDGNFDVVFNDIIAWKGNVLMFEAILRGKISQCLLDTAYARLKGVKLRGQHQGKKQDPNQDQNDEQDQGIVGSYALELVSRLGGQWSYNFWDSMGKDPRFIQEAIESAERSGNLSTILASRAPGNVNALLHFVTMANLHKGSSIPLIQRFLREGVSPLEEAHDGDTALFGAMRPWPVFQIQSARQQRLKHIFWNWNELNHRDTDASLPIFWILLHYAMQMDKCNGPLIPQVCEPQFAVDAFRWQTLYMYISEAINEEEAIRLHTKGESQARFNRHAKASRDERMLWFALHERLEFFGKPCLTHDARGMGRRRRRAKMAYEASLSLELDPEKTGLPLPKFMTNYSPEDQALFDAYRAERMKTSLKTT